MSLPAAAAPTGSALTRQTIGMEPSPCFLESALLTVLSGETTALTAEAAVSFPTRLIFPGSTCSVLGVGRLRAVWNSAASACSQHGCPTCVTVTNLRRQHNSVLSTPGPSENLRMYGWCWGLPGVTQIYGLTLRSNPMLEYGLKKPLEICTTDATPQLTHG